MNLVRKNEIDISCLRNDFPIFKQKNRKMPLIYLDSASSAQKPTVVIDALSNFYSQGYANIHRGIYELSEHASEIYEAVRQNIKEFIQATHTEEIIFTSGTTESINLVAQTISKKWKTGDEIIISGMEHHSNIVPWYLLKQQLGLELKIIPVTDEGALNIEAYQQLFTSRTKLVAVSHASNVLGTINPIKELAAIAHQHHVPILVDGAQAAPHMQVNVQALDCDFYAFSGHKLYGPTGIGVLYGKKQLLDVMPPYQGGGGMIEQVRFDEITFVKAPHKFEAGTPNIAGVMGLNAAIQYVQSIGMETIFSHEQRLLKYSESKLLAIPGLRMIGTAKPKLGVFSFVLEGIHPHDIGTVLDHEGIAVRAGHHCAMPVMERFAVPATVRVSLGIYNNEKDIDKLIEGLNLTKRLFA